MPTKDPPEEIHYVLKKKMRIDQRMAKLALSEDPDAEGRPFSVHEWPGIPLLELTPASAGVEAEDVPPPDAEESPPALSPGMSSNLTRSHRAVISARDKVYNAYKAYYVERATEIARASEASLSDERQWKLVWDKLVAACKVGGID